MDQYMLMPRFLLGTFSEVRRHTRAYFRSLDRAESMDLELVDTRSTDGLIVIDDQERFRAEEPHFQMHALFEAADSARYRSLHQSIFDAVLAHPWGPLTLLGSMVGLLRVHHVITEASWMAALSNMMKWWNLYEAEGPRFAIGMRTGDLWTIGGSLKGLLREKGIPQSELGAPLPEGGLTALLARHPTEFGDVLRTGKTEGT
jgi:hypothetical protein